MTEKAFTPDLLGDCIPTKRTNNRTEAAALHEVLPWIPERLKT